MQKDRNMSCSSGNCDSNNKQKQECHVEKGCPVEEQCHVEEEGSCDSKKSCCDKDFKCYSDKELVKTLKHEIEELTKENEHHKHKHEVATRHFNDLQSQYSAEIRKLKHELDDTKTIAIKKYAIAMLKILSLLKQSVVYAANTPMQESLEGILYCYEQQLASCGVTTISPKIGDVFHPEKMQVIGVVHEHDSAEHDTIIKIEEVGYEVSKLVLQPAKVLVYRSGE